MSELLVDRTTGLSTLTNLVVNDSFSVQNITAKNISISDDQDIGGNCNISAALIVGGSSTTNGLTSTGNVSLTGTSTLSVAGLITATGGVDSKENVTIATGKTLSVGGSTTTNGLTSTGNVSLTGTSTLGVAGLITATGGVESKENVTIATGKTLTVGGATTTNGLTSQSNVSITGNCSITGTLTAGNIQHGRVNVSGTNGTVSFPVAFASIPTVSATLMQTNTSYGFFLQVTNVTTTGFSWRQFAATITTNSQVFLATDAATIHYVARI